MQCHGECEGTTYVGQDADDLSETEEMSFLHVVWKHHAPSRRNAGAHEPREMKRGGGGGAVQARPIHARSA